MDIWNYIALFIHSGINALIELISQSFYRNYYQCKSFPYMQLLRITNNTAYISLYANHTSSISLAILEMVEFSAFHTLAQYVIFGTVLTDFSSN